MINNKDFYFEDWDNIGLTFELWLDCKRYIVPDITDIYTYRKLFYEEYKSYCIFNNYTYEEYQNIKGGVIVG